MSRKITLLAYCILFVPVLIFSACDRILAEGDFDPYACAEQDNEIVIINFLSDPENCGACGVSCQRDEVCIDGRCGIKAPLNCANQGKTECAGTCIDLSTNDKHCSKCDNACAAHESCMQGICVDRGCSLLQPNRCNGVCTILAFDPANCGACGKRCSNKYPSCEGGVCVKLGKP